MNKILKDLVVKSRTMMGFDAPYVLGYDCHGLPIELKVDRELGPKKREMSLADFRRACRAYASRFIDVMSGEFQRLGVFGDWDHLYLTMDFRYQAAIARALGKFVEQGLVYKGKKPVHWCIHCRTALAEAEVEYDGPLVAVDLRRVPAVGGERRRDRARGCPALAGRPVSVLIWTTTPWTIPSNLAIAFHPEFDYAAYDVDGRAVIVAEALAPSVAAGDRADVRRAGRADEGRGARAHPLPAPAVHARFGRRAGRLRHARAGHRRRAHGAGPRQRRLHHRREVRARDLRAGRPGRTLPRHGRALRRAARVRRQPGHRQGAQGRAAGCGIARRSSIVSALLALPQPGHLPGHVAVVHQDGWRSWPSSDVDACAPRALDAIDTRRRMAAGVGTRPPLQHDREPSRLVHLAPARLGRADPGGRLHEVRRGAADAGARRARRRCLRRLRRRRVVRAADRGVHPRRA